MSASFWKFGNGFSTVSAITNILEANQPEDVNLVDILDENDLIQELLSNNALLLEYLREPAILNQLVDLIINDDFEISTDDRDISQETIKQADVEEEEDSQVSDSQDILTDLTAEKDDINTDEPEPTEEDVDTKSESQDETKTDNDSDSDSDSDSGLSSNNDDSFGDQELSEIETETEQEAHTRRASISAEILSADVWSLTDTFMENLKLLEKLWSILDKPSPLPMNLATYFMKINEHLLDMKMDEMIQFILNQNKLVDRFMRHIDNPPLMDFLLKVISTDKLDNSTGVIDILQEQKLIPELISFLGPEIPSYIQSAAADFLKAFVTISANSNTDNTTIGPNELTRELVSEPIVRELVRLMLYGGTGLGNGVGIIIEIIRKNNSDYDIVPVLYITIESHPPSPRDPIYLGSLVKIFSEAVPKFTEMLERKENKRLETPFGSIEPLGFERFKICELVAELLHCSNMALLNDPKGEKVVKERDSERERLKKLHRVAFKFNEAYPKDETNNDNEDDLVRGDEEVGTEENFEADTSIDFINLTIDENDTIDSFNNNYDMNESQLRQSPVVGDQLKISLADNNIIITILNSFFRFPWNNFLHNVVFDIVQQVLNGSMDVGYNKYLAIDLFGRGDITKLIIEGQTKCDDYEESTGLRLGYMGHLTLIAEEVVKFVQLYPKNSISSIIDEATSSEEWEKYVSETLYETREKYNAILGGNGEFEEGEMEDINRPDDMEMEYLMRSDSSQILDPTVDNDLRNSGYEEEGHGEYDEGDHYDEDVADAEDIHGSQNGSMKHDKFGTGESAEEEDHHNSDSDDSEGDQFSRYMSQQITSDLPNRLSSSDDDDEEDEELTSWNYSNYYKKSAKTPSTPPNRSTPTLEETNDTMIPNPNLEDFDDDDDDDYIDPNDDGQIYTRGAHPLYDSNGILNTQSSHTNDVLSDDDEDDNNEDIDLGLTRSSSKGEMNWDEDEQNRLIKMADYIQHH